MSDKIKHCHIIHMRCSDADYCYSCCLSHTAWSMCLYGELAWGVNAYGLKEPHIRRSQDHPMARGTVALLRGDSQAPLAQWTRSVLGPAC